jgi:hypothetical protein
LNFSGHNSVKNPLLSQKLFGTTGFGTNAISLFQVAEMDSFFLYEQKEGSEIMVYADISYQSMFCR